MRITKTINIPAMKNNNTLVLMNKIIKCENMKIWKILKIKKNKRFMAMSEWMKWMNEWNESMQSNVI